MKKKLLSLILASVLVLSLLPAQAFAGDGGEISFDPSDPGSILRSGECGEDLTWTLYDDGSLIFYGTGAMYDYSSSGNTPVWKQYGSTISSVTLPDGVTHIGDCAFLLCTGISTISIGTGLQSIGTSAFSGCSSLEDIYFSGSRAAWDSVEKGQNNASLNFTDVHCTGCSVTYDPNGGSGAPAAQAKQPGVPLTLSSVKPVRTGYDFLGWATSATAASAEYQPSAVYAKDEDLDLFAVWAPVTYTVSYNANKGSGAPAAQTKTYGKSLALSSVKPVRTGYDFLGWATSATASSAAYQPGGQYTGNSAVTLYAVWKAKTYTVTYNANGGSNAPAAQTKTYGAALTLSSAVPTRGGYVFVGWAKAKNAVTADYQPAAKYTANENITLYAVWQRNTSGYAVKFSGSGLPEGISEVDVDGRTVNLTGGELFLQNEDASVLACYEIKNADSDDPHARYPVAMRVWKLSFSDGEYTATEIPEFENILQYAGSSIRITGKKGIRMITAIDKSKKSALTGAGLGGYRLEEYGTVLCFASEIVDGSLTLSDSYQRSNYAYSRAAGADPVFKTTASAIQYTNVLVGFSLENCKSDIAMRPYIKLSDAQGNVITVYGGIVSRSIGYIASQNRNAFSAGTSAYNFIWEIIHYVYGNIYD